MIANKTKLIGPFLFFVCIFQAFTLLGNTLFSRYEKNAQNVYFSNDVTSEESSAKLEEYKLQLVDSIKSKKLDYLGYDVNKKDFRNVKFDSEKLDMNLKVNDKFQIFGKKNSTPLDMDTTENKRFKLWKSNAYLEKIKLEKELKELKLLEEEEARINETLRAEASSNNEEKVNNQAQTAENKIITIENTEEINQENIPVKESEEKISEEKVAEEVQDKKEEEKVEELSPENTCRNFHAQSRKIPFNFSNGDGESFNFNGMTIRSFANAVYNVSEKSEEILSKEISSPINVPKVINFFNYNPTFDTVAAVESAAMHNKDHYIKIYVRNTDDFNKKAAVWLDRIKFNYRLRILPLNFAEKFYNTPLQAWYNNKEYLNSDWQFQNLGNAFRLALIWKNGGVYMDMDIISLNSFKDLKHIRLVAREDGTRINNAVLSFPPKDPYIWSAMEIFVNNWNGYNWGNNGPLCLSRAMIRDCSWNSLATAKMEVFENFKPKGRNVKRHSPEREAEIESNIEYLKKYGSQVTRPYCSSIVTASRIRFYPVHYSQSNLLLKDWWENCNLLKYIYHKSVGIHWWNRMFKFKKNKTELSPNSTIVKIFNDQCPKFMDSYGLKQLG
ncbi:hypothetical protein HK099_004227 [Clydaea vesicula]|uniref:Alpha 1,4-glycosyltransferase domain-containing protein n=1 Tax=Clydaea vesicula TaxID=447962 RepID=A0AAD5XYC3_9FUNG|nr:hypothetical protein HK099_004227 [Clydaea vesicula]